MSGITTYNLCRINMFLHDIGLDHVDYAARFASLFSCEWDLIDCALMSIGDYGQ